MASVSFIQPWYGLSKTFLARLDEVPEELLYYPWCQCWHQRWRDGGIGVSKKFNVKVFYVMGKALSGELSCPCDRSCSKLSWFCVLQVSTLFFYTGLGDQYACY